MAVAAACEGAEEQGKAVPRDGPSGLTMTSARFWSEEADDWRLLRTLTPLLSVAGQASQRCFQTRPLSLWQFSVPEMPFLHLPTPVVSSNRYYSAQTSPQGHSFIPRYRPWVVPSDTVCRPLPDGTVVAGAPRGLQRQEEVALSG